MIEMASSKGMAPVPYSPPEVVLPDVISLEMFDQWDTDFDGKLSTKEVNTVNDLITFRAGGWALIRYGR